MLASNSDKLSLGEITRATALGRMGAMQNKALPVEGDAKASSTTLKKTQQKSSKRFPGANRTAQTASRSTWKQLEEPKTGYTDCSCSANIHLLTLSMFAKGIEFVLRIGSIPSPLEGWPGHFSQPWLTNPAHSHIIFIHYL